MKRLTLALNKDHTKYTDSFLLDLPRLQAAADIQKNFVGRWYFPEVKAIIEFKKDKTGTWEEAEQTYNIQWKMDEKTVTINIEKEVYNFIVVEATSSKLSAVWKERNFVLIGCRISLPDK